ncbi:hypothetical protein HHK36_021725 [Tetracentron sinense]|uniref:RNase H type-1 domain-containing protein n=1 Tax=Tetracentron sinense TaxID=13715 RepID=A0A835D839_TETSI|nr:hypothetical protein HHK36_021725 [Tetracentron sinense]
MQSIKRCGILRKMASIRCGRGIIGGMSCTLKGDWPMASSSVVWGSSCWKGIWALKLPPKISWFLWRCMHNAIEVSRELNRRRIAVDRYCPFCGNGEESVLHMLLECDHASLKHLEGEEFPPISGDSFGPYSLHSSGSQYVDGSLAKQGQIAGIEGIARDHRGRILGGFAQARRGGSPLVVEAATVPEALSWARVVGWNKVWFLSDAKVIMDSILSKSATVHWEVRAILEDIRVVLREEPDFHILHTPRVANAYAHRISAFGSSLAGGGSFVGVHLPPWN